MQQEYILVRFYKLPKTAI